LKNSLPLFYSKQSLFKLQATAFSDLLFNQHFI